MTSKWICIVDMGEAAGNERYLVVNMPENVGTTQQTEAALRARIKDGKLALDNGNSVQVPSDAPIAVYSRRGTGAAVTQLIATTTVEIAAD
jgi:hypothetical protein